MSWSWIPQFENLYRATPDGQVISYRNRKPRFLKPYLKKGYLYVDLYKDTARYTFRLNRLILLTFVGKPPHESSVSRHLNGNPLDNRLENLAWGTQSENEQDKQRNRWAEKER